MSLFKVSPKVGAFVGFFKDKFIMGTYDLPRGGLSGDRVTLTVFPTISEDGDFIRSGSRILTLDRDCIFQFANMQNGCSGIPKTGLLIYIEPDATMMQQMNADVVVALKSAHEMIARLNSQLGQSQRLAEDMQREPAKTLMRAAEQIGTMGKKARAYPQNTPYFDPRLERRRPREDEDNP